MQLLQAADSGIWKKMEEFSIDLSKLIILRNYEDEEKADEIVMAFDEYVVI